MYWRVRAMDRPFTAPGYADGIEGITSPTQRFFWDPVSFTSMSPSNGASVAVPTLSWTPGTPAEKYRIELYKNGQGSPFHQATTYATTYTPVDVKLGAVRRALHVATDGDRGRRASSRRPRAPPSTSSLPSRPQGRRRSQRSPVAAPTQPTLRAPNLTWEPWPGADHYRSSDR